MPHFARHSEGHYLKTLFKLSSRPQARVNNIALAKALGLNPDTELEMARKLAGRGLVALQADKSIELTDKGRKRPC